MNKHKLFVSLVGNSIILKYINFQFTINKLLFYFDTFAEFEEFLKTSPYNIIHNEENYVIITFHLKICNKSIPIKFTLKQETKLTLLEKEIQIVKQLNAKILEQLKYLELESIKGLDEEFFEIRIEKLKEEMYFENMRDSLFQCIDQHQVEIENLKKDCYELQTKIECIKKLEKENYDLRTQLSNIHTIEPS